MPSLAIDQTADSSKHQLVSANQAHQFIHRL